MPAKAKILLARIAYGGWEHAALGNFCIQTAVRAQGHPLIDDILHAFVDVCPTPAARHRAIRMARDSGCRIMVQVDADTVPHPDFVLFAAEWLLAQPGPSVLCSPYVCGLPDCRVQAFRIATKSAHPGDIGALEHFGREEAALKTGVERVAAAGTGCFACHVEAFDRIAMPYFSYEYADAMQDRVVCTEDVNCFRDLTAAGVPVCVSWDHWSDHVKEGPVSRPRVVSPEQIWDRTRGMLLARQEAAEAPAAPEAVPAPPKAPAARQHKRKAKGRA